MDTVFAENYPRLEADSTCIKFPADITTRKARFVPESFEHPAKANVWMVEEIIKFTSDPGDLIMDIFGGTGTILVGVPLGRKVAMLELNDRYADIIDMNRALPEFKDGISFVMRGANQLLLPNFNGNVQSIITSPPYAGALSGSGGSAMQQNAVSTKTSEALQTYGHTADDAVQASLIPYNLAGFNNFMFAQEMRKLYKQCLTALKPGGFLTIIIKDRIRQGIKDELGDTAFHTMRQVGFTPYAWERWAPPGTIFTKSHRAKGRKVIEDEHIIVMQKPNG
jgi:modification methylase